MLELILIRHGQSVADIENRLEGQADFPLTALGQEQAKKLAAWLRTNCPCDTVISSPLQRAAQTADIIGGKLSARVYYDDDLKELSKGVIDGLLKMDAAAKYPRPPGGHPYDAPIHGGESLQSFADRVRRFWVRQVLPLAESKSDNRLLIVTHGGVINMLFACCISLSLPTDISLHTAHTGVHCWRLDAAGRGIVFANITDHLKNSYNKKAR